MCGYVRRHVGPKTLREFLDLIGYTGYYDEPDEEPVTKHFYSGRDSSLMDVLSEIYSKKGKSRLFWCGYGDMVPAPVAKLLQSTEQFGRTAVYVATDGFDDLIFRIALRQLEGESLVEAKSILADIKDFNIGTTKFSAPPLPITSLIKSNAYPLSCPTQILKVDVDFPEGVGRRKWIEDNLSTDAGIFTVSSNYIFALSDSNYLSSALTAVIRSLPINVALSNEDIRANNGFQSLLRRALVQAAARALNVDSDNVRSIWDKGYSNTTSYERVKYYVYKAVSFRLVHLNEKLHVVLIPEVVIKRTDGEFADKEISKILKNAIYGYQHNDVFDNDLKYWTSHPPNAHRYACRTL